MAKDGIGLVTGIAVAAIVFSIIGFSADSPVAWIFAGLCLLTMFFVVNFFRDPERSIPTREGIIVSPGDGKVIDVSEVEENSFLRSRAHKISIFLSVFDVHVNRIPMSGRIEYFD
ncbi:MAG: phosphatidylserine decarboxylase, partial [bacterium]